MADFSNKVVYQIYPKSFRDTNGDGFGDIPGVIEKLDYLQDLGVDYLWLTPFFPSPQHDNGYDVADYRSVDPKFGTMEDLEELIRQGEDRGIGLMLDMVFNHTSTEHTWFQKALAGDERYQKYYIFKDGAPDCPPTNWQSKFGGPAWEYVPSLKKWYLRLYDVTQADLNWDNPEVREELKEILRFWKKKGIQAFRFDVINLVSKPEHMEDDLEGDGRRFYLKPAKGGRAELKFGVAHTAHPFSTESELFYHNSRYNTSATQTMAICTILSSSYLRFCAKSTIVIVDITAKCPVYRADPAVF